MSVNLSPHFVHLRVHSAYSLAEGALHIKKIPALCTAGGMEAAAITDTDAMFGVAEFSETMHKAGLLPIIGVQWRIILPAQHTTAAPVVAPMVLLAANADGYRHLTALSAVAAQDHGLPFPAVPLAQLCAHAHGLIALTGGSEGLLGQLLQSNAIDRAVGTLHTLKEAFHDRLYIELQRLGLPHEASTEAHFTNFAYDYDLPLVATNDVLFANAAFAPAHDALTCIANGTFVGDEKRLRRSPQQWFKSAEQMRALFADLPEAADNTVEIALRCNFKLKSLAPQLPRFGDDEQALLLQQATDGLAQRLANNPLFATDDEYTQRLHYEANIINRMGFAGYFLIVADFIGYAKAQDIAVGPGRGSGAGSLIAWALQITDLDPLRFGLLFERFLNPERVSMPDFDIDFCQERRDEVISYVQQKYGADRVAQIITFGKLQARAVLRDVGRVQQLPYGQVDRLCKLIPNNPADPYTIARALAEDVRLQQARDTEDGVADLLNIADQLEGLYRHASTHAAGVVITDRPLHQMMPVHRDPRSNMPVTQFNMKWAEWAGAVKFDFLGLKTLTVLQKAVALLQLDGITVDLERMPFDDKPTYAMLSNGDTAAVFQLESAGMRDALRRLKPDCLEDIIALVALYRPGPMDNIPKYIACKRGDEAPDYLHPSLEAVLRETYGVIIYQEQVMQIAQILSGYSLGEADLLRRAMGKKIKAEMDEQKARFVSGALAQNIDGAQAESIFELVAKFAGYGFNKSHAAAYAVVSYQTAYMKANYPAHFMAAVMTLDAAHTEKLLAHKQELDRLGIAVLPPDVNAAQAEFTVREGRVRYALGAVKGFGSAAAHTLATERAANGPYTSVFNLMRRHDSKTLNKRTLETLINAGAFDCFGIARRRLFEATSQLNAIVGENTSQSLFGADSSNDPPLPAVAEWSQHDRLLREFSALGLYLSAHPLDSLAKALRSANVMRYQDLMQKAQDSGSSVAALLAGVIVAHKERKSAKGNRFMTMQMSDNSGVYEAMLFSDMADKHKQNIVVGNILLLACEAEYDGENIRLRVREVTTADTLPTQDNTPLIADIEPRRAEQVFSALAPLLSAAAKKRSVRSNVQFRWFCAQGEVILTPHPQAQFGNTKTLAQQLRQIVGIIAVDV